jgi:hypothetical protein
MMDTVIGLGIFTRLGRRYLNRRRDRTPAVLRKLARAETNARLARRLLPIANALSGLSARKPLRRPGMDRQALRDWVICYNAHGPDGLYDCWGERRPPGTA